MLALLVAGLAASQDSPLNYQDQGWERETALFVGGCDNPQFNSLQILDTDPLGLVGQRDGIWTGEPHDFTELHAAGHEPMLPTTVKVLKYVLNQGRDRRLAYGFRAEAPKNISAGFPCYDNELCRFEAYYQRGAWFTSFGKVWLNMAPRALARMKRDFPVYQRKANHFSLQFVGPVSVRLTFVPIVWGYWWRVLHVESFLRQRWSCRGLTIAPRIDEFPDGWITPVISKFINDVA